MTAEKEFLIWSFEHEAWWRPNRRGYTENVFEAGRYSQAETDEILRQANVVTRNEAAYELGTGAQYVPEA